jgi:hypothetical protein
VIEVLSPSNKTRGSSGRASFLRKRREVYATPAHWMEIDLLRAGARTTDPSPPTGAEYHAFLSRAGDPRQEFVWPMPLRERLSSVGIPLHDGDPDVPLDLQAAIDYVYARGGYAVDPTPPMSPDALAWCRARVADARSSPSS